MANRVSKTITDQEFLQIHMVEEIKRIRIDS